ncbi:hypothetical protein F4779DRAFT_622376 [Xylariaceae sp. FL0662B]|nr:hypothetical protein F4779DRAFT_622376 [Xylariaceae sp. FL0662B]
MSVNKASTRPDRGERLPRRMGTPDRDVPRASPSALHRAPVAAQETTGPPGSYYTPSPAPKALETSHPLYQPHPSTFPISVNTYIQPYRHPQTRSASSSSQGMILTPPSETYEGDEFDCYSYHGSPAPGSQGHQPVHTYSSLSPEQSPDHWSSPGFEARASHDALDRLWDSLQTKLLGGVRPARHTGVSSTSTGFTKSNYFGASIAFQLGAAQTHDANAHARHQQHPWAGSVNESLGARFSEQYRLEREAEEKRVRLCVERGRAKNRARQQVPDPNPKLDNASSWDTKRATSNNTANQSNLVDVFKSSRLFHQVFMHGNQGGTNAIGSAPVDTTLSSWVDDLEFDTKRGPNFRTDEEASNNIQGFLKEKESVKGALENQENTSDDQEDASENEQESSEDEDDMEED